MTMEWASFFTGIGGFEVGGFHANTMVEIDPTCRAVLARHFPNAQLKGDIHDVKGTDLGRVDGFVGGFPCQDTSTAAPHRSGLAGARSGNFFEFARLLDEYQRLIEDRDPRWVVLENPVGLLSSPGVGCAQACGAKRCGHPKLDRTGWDMAAVVRGLEDLGYGWAYRVVDGRFLGSTQKRERVIVVGHRGGDARPAWQVLADGGPGDGQAPARTQRRGQGGPRPGGGAQAGDDTLIWRKSARARKSIEAGGYETWVPAEYSNTLTGFDGGGPNRQTHIVLQDGRLRTFTLTEWERLQGFPDGWTDGVPDSSRYTMLGNAMHTGMAAWLNTRFEAVNAALPQLEVSA